jgi:lipopolysaccharide/colanic/teichoic acid biosynthesis glycosyltransferase
MKRRTASRRRAPHPSIAGRRGGVKRAFDLVFAALALALAAPLMLAIGAVVWLTSRGPVLYRQRRLGLYGRPFTILKFRTMVVDAEADGTPIWASMDDARCTRVGGLLRRFGLDELPQLWNVLRGEMSLVGPRPERPEFAREFARRWPGYNDRFAVRGGLTGLAQVEGWRGDSHIGERLAWDRRYIAQWSLLGDVVILARTVPEILFQRRARLRRGAGATRRVAIRAREVETGGA